MILFDPRTQVNGSGSSSCNPAVRSAGNVSGTGAVEHLEE